VALIAQDACNRATQALTCLALDRCTPTITQRLGCCTASAARSADVVGDAGVFDSAANQHLVHATHCR